MGAGEINLLLPSRNVITGKAVMVTSSDLWRLGGKVISNVRMFLLVCEGCMEVRIDGKPYTLDKNTFVDMYDKTEFTFEHFDSQCKAYCLIPTPDFVSESLKSFRVGNDKYFWSCMAFPVMRITEDAKAMLARQMELLADTFFNTSHNFRLDLALVYFKSFQIELNNVLANHWSEFSQSETSYNRADALAMDFMNLVWKYFVKEHKIEFYASKLCISPKHLTRILKAKLCITPHDVIAGEILHLATAMLESDEYSVQQIASHLNFSDQASFCKFFKKHKGMSPSEYRQK